MARFFEWMAGRRSRSGLSRTLVAGLLVAGMLGPASASTLRAGFEAAGVDPDRAMVADFYQRRDWRPVWTAGAAGRVRTLTVLAALSTADRHGLPVAAYGVKRIGELLAQSDAAAEVALEELVSLGLVRYARDLGQGRIAGGPTFDVPGQVTSFDGPAFLEAAEAALDLPAFLAALAPTRPGYAPLQAELAALRVQAAAGGWTPVPDGEKLQLGSAGRAVVALRERLAASGDLPILAAAGAAPGSSAASSALFDAGLEAAVRRYQARHGLAADGVVGRSTLATLNMPVAERMAQLVANLERLRHHPVDLGRQLVAINIPDYHLTFTETPAAGGPVRMIYESRVVVGTVKDQTPTFADAISYLELNPVWHVPRSIALDELLPAARNDPGYLARHGYGLYAGGQAVDPHAVDWSALGRDNFPYRIRQQPGDRNALGRVKFMFPNEFNVYIHDTPSKKLFGRSQRAFSHGCIRLSNPFEFAGLLLADQGWDRARIEQTVESGRTRTVRLGRPLPVRISYVTAWAEADGTIQYREDVYGRDEVLAQALARPANRPVAAAPPRTIVIQPEPDLEAELLAPAVGQAAPLPNG